MKVVKGYKGFDENLCCRGFQYKVGKTYEINGTLKMCDNGFHFCKKLSNVNEFYSFSNENYRYCEVEAVGQVIDDEDGKKSVTDKIKIVREIPREKFIEMSNTGANNTGWCNSGDYNSGSRNSGDYNSGSRNSGNWNSGSRNSGNWNSGNRNSGNWNSGDYNSGNWNSGDWNKTNRSAGVFCTEEPKLIIFNKETNMSYEEWKNTRAYDVLDDLPVTRWINFNNMTDKEKKQFPNAETCGGYLKILSRKEASNEWWSQINDYDKKEIFSLPNFDLKIFNEIMELTITKKEYNQVMKNANL